MSKATHSTNTSKIGAMVILKMQIMKNPLQAKNNILAAIILDLLCLIFSTFLIILMYYTSKFDLYQYCLILVIICTIALPMLIFYFFKKAKLCTIYICKIKELKEERKEKLIEKYGNDIATEIINGHIQIGFTENMLFDSWGQPLHKENKIFKNNTKTKYFYQGYMTQRGTIGYKKYVQTENGIIVGWGDI